MSQEKMWSDEAAKALLASETIEGDGAAWLMREYGRLMTREAELARREARVTERESRAGRRQSELRRLRQNNADHAVGSREPDGPLPAQ